MKTITKVLIVMIAVLGISTESVATPLAYVANYNDNTVSVIDTDTNVVVATIPVGSEPYGTAVHPTGNFVYVTNVASDTVSVIDAITKTVSDTIHVGDGPLCVAINPDGSFVYVTNGLDDTVSVIDTSTNAAVAVIPVGDRPDGIAVNPDGTLVYVVNFSGGNMSVIRTSDNQVINTVGPLGWLPEFVAVNPDGTLVYVVVTNDDIVRVIDSNSNSIIATVPVGEEPRGVAVHPDGNYVYVANSTGDSVSIIDSSTNSVIATIPVGDGATAVAVHPDGTHLYVTNHYSNNVSVLDLETNVVTATVPVGSGPFSLGKFIGPKPVIPVRYLPDTGQTQSYTDTFGEDSDYTINPPSYTKLDANGNEGTNPDGSWTMVRDNITGLIWEVKTDDGTIHDRDDKYSWQNAHDIFITQLNNDNFGGFNDWRLPSVKELRWIVKGVHFPSINSSNHWATTVCVHDTNLAWVVHFGLGEAAFSALSNTYHVRAVRGGEPVPPDRFVDNGDGTVADTLTGLMWQQQTVGPMTWESALTYCENLSLGLTDDWRLPNRNELQSLVDYDRYNVSIDTIAFPDTVSSNYWSSTTAEAYTGEAQVVEFYYGTIDETAYSRSYYVRAVRGPVPIGNTPPGTDVPVEPEDCPEGTVGGTPVTLTFDQVDVGGNTTLCTSPTGPPPSSGFKLIPPPTYYEINTTATYTGNIQVCINYGNDYPNENQLKLFHKSEGQPWRDVTSLPLDTENNIICGIVDAFSVFAIFAPAPEIEILDVYVTRGGGGTRRHFWIGDRIYYNIDYEITGGEPSAHYKVMGSANSIYQYCSSNKARRARGVDNDVGPGVHTIRFQKRVPECVKPPDYVTAKGEWPKVRWAVKW